MSDTNTQSPGWKKRLAHELSEYWLNFIYLAFFFGTFTWYRRFILAEVHITYVHYGIAVIKALILAKVILIGDALHLGRKLEEKPLIVSTLYKSVVFCVFVGIFSIVEHGIDGWLHGKAFLVGVEELLGQGKYQLLAECLVTFFAFIPFFAFHELERLLGEGKIRQLFFRNRAGANYDLVKRTA